MGMVPPMSLGGIASKHLPDFLGREWESSIRIDKNGNVGKNTHLGMVNTTYKNGDDWGMVYGIVLPCFTHINI